MLPCLYSGSRSALSNIVEELTQVPYLEQIIIGLDRANEAEYRHALSFFNRLPQRPEVLWNDGRDSRRSTIGWRLMVSHPPKKVRVERLVHVWLSPGDGSCQAVTLHDCDITNYERGMLVVCCIQWRTRV